MAHFPRNLISMRKADFGLTFNQNKRSVDGMLIVLARPNGLSRSRLGLAISKKHSPRAVERNRIKRLIRESFMHHQPFNTSVDTVVINRPGIKLKSNHEVFQSLSRHWQKINDKLDRQDI